MKRTNVITQGMKFTLMTICTIQIIAFCGCSTTYSKRGYSGIYDLPPQLSLAEQNKISRQAFKDQQEYYELNQKFAKLNYGDPPLKGYQPLDPIPVELEWTTDNEKSIMP